MFKEYFTEAKSSELNEGAWDKIVNWAINNIDIIKDKYIKDSKNYGMKNFIVNSPGKNIKVIRQKGKYFFTKVTTAKGMELLMLIDKKDAEDNEDMLQGDFPIHIFGNNLPELENNGITPYIFNRTYEA